MAQVSGQANRRYYSKRIGLKKKAGRRRIGTRCISCRAHPYSRECMGPHFEQWPRWRRLQIWQEVSSVDKTSWFHLNTFLINLQGHFYLISNLLECNRYSQRFLATLDDDQ